VLGAALEDGRGEEPEHEHPHGRRGEYEPTQTVGGFAVCCDIGPVLSHIIYCDPSYLSHGSTGLNPGTAAFGVDERLCSRP